MLNESFHVKGIYTTWSGKDRSYEKIVKEGLQKKLFFCVNVFPGVRSYYENTQTEEHVLIFKTEERCLPKAFSFIKEEHIYEIPCLLIIDFSSFSSEESYKNWALSYLFNKTK